MKKRRIALITGASSGIGKAFAAGFARSGFDLIITGRRMDKLACLAQQLKDQTGTSVKVIRAELSDEQDIQKLTKIIQSHDDIFVLVNNAGFGAGVEFCKNQLADHMRMLQVHVAASVRLVYAILPQMIRRREGIIINVSSLGAFMPAPGSSMYSATKLFLKSFTESLHMEVHQYGIKVQCLCPGFTHTDFHERRTDGQKVKGNRMMWMDAEKVVVKSLSSIRKERIICVPGIINRILLGISSLIPRKMYYRIMGRSGNIKVSPGFFNSIVQFIEKTVPFLFTAEADKVGFLH